ncbi:Tad domain-containing protein [Roseobacter ponti]|uniref:Putative Flp pilus-assembly TadG-like N-terminal domain-containing protein n=1 Tax=Roseobacter ponti TaxID=1891787 RepID=A0A858SUY6_9RHOB|nr:Tad domain-containing protein [Roseobacter ponti]QJF51798.1 hypothetical protein G3256_11810 [Roseobacter ponti]
MVLQSVNDFHQDEEGGILVFAGLSLAVMFGMAAMVFDMGRMATTQTELQTFADNVALAAAGELDGATDSVTRANLAAANLTSGHQTFGQGNNVLSGAVDYSLCYTEILPADDLAPINCMADPLDTDNQQLAAYVEVTVTPRDVDLPFARVLAGLTDNAEPDNTVSAVAVAGFVTYACDITPLMFCIPDADWGADANAGQSVFLRSGGNGAQWGPGAFGFLDVTAASVADPSGPCAGLNGSKLTACMIAAVNNINACFTQRGVDIEPGQKVGIENAIFNTRFDMFNSTMSQFANNPEYAPGPHVAKGFKAKNGNGQCIGQATELTDNTIAFPPDLSFPNGGRFGTGLWDVNGYIETNHGQITTTDSDGNEVEVSAPSYMYDELVTYVASNPTASRYDIYKEEIRQATLVDVDGNVTYRDIFENRDETGSAQCSAPSNVIPFDPDNQASIDRRLFVAAAIDCDANPISGAQKNVPVKEFVKIFLTQPVGESTTNPPNFEFYVEVVGSAGGLGKGSQVNGAFNDVVQLYR